MEGRPDLLFSEISKQYPNIPVSRPKRLYDAVKRIAAPTKPSLGRPAKLTGSPLASYRNRVWKPRITRTAQTSGFLSKVFILTYCIFLLYS